MAQPESASGQPVAIVGIGASAGGLEALEGLLRRLPDNTGMGFVVVTHLARGHQSALSQILGRATQMSVEDAQDGHTLRPNRISVCPPDHVLTVSSGTLRLHLRESDAQRRPVDVFLSSLAEDRAESAVGILLSGSGSDGTLGMKAIKERGGFTIAQGADGGAGPAQTGMPDAAIAEGVVDLVLPIEEIGPRLADHARRLKQMPSPAGDDSLPEEHATEAEARSAIYEILRTQVGHDFSGYKDRTFMRRVRRRMQVTEIEGLEAYIERLRTDAEEVKLLFRDLLIGVTNFFRDPGAFEALEKLVIPRLFEGKDADETVRVWVPGCATGEEVYSVAMLIREHMDRLKTVPRVQLFATDIDESALAVARLGRYPEPLLSSVSPQRLKRFFVADDVTRAVSKEIREMCMFSSHNLVRDPPFSRMDLVSCRNLLIYFGPDFQSRALPVFHFALRPGGFLFLGTSENVTAQGELFLPLEKKFRIFQRRDHVATPLHLSRFFTRGRDSAPGKARHEPGMVNGLRRAVETRVLERFAPAHVVIDAEGEVLHYSARTGKYLEHATGSPNQHLLSIARRGLRIDLRAAMKEAAETRRPAARSDVSLEIDDRVQRINIVVEPLGGSDGDPLYVVLFQDAGAPVPASAERPASGTADDAKFDRLEQELRETRERLQATIEEYEAAVEELKSSNEEMQSVNEELQSTNEELETSREEIQSVNEELQTINTELAAKVDETEDAHADLRNVFDSTKVACVFLDENLVIRNFTPAMTEIFNLISSDRGRPLTDIAGNLEPNADFRREIRSVFENGVAIERRVHRADGSAHYLMRILPYRGRHGRIEGALLIFVDVTSVVDAEASHNSLVEENLALAAAAGAPPISGPAKRRALPAPRKARRNGGAKPKNVSS